MTERPKLTRRDFLEVGVAASAAALALLYARRGLRPLDSLAQTVSPDDKIGTPQPGKTIEPATPTSTSPPEELATEPTKGWEIPKVEEIKSLLANPEFFTEPQGQSKRRILTPQFDENQYTRLDSRYLPYLESSNYKGNSCSQAVIATVLKTFTYFKTGDVPDITVADVINYLMDKDYQGYHLIRPNNITMQDDPLKWALESFGKETNLYRVIGLTPDWGLDNTHIVPTSEWSALFKAGKEKVLDKGGLVVARVLKYGIPTGTEGHFMVISSFNAGGEPLIVDSIGPFKDHKRQGDARTVALTSYVERGPANWATSDWANRPGLFWMAGVVPTF